MKMKTNIKLSRKKKNRHFDSIIETSFFFASTATGQTIRQEIPPIRKEILNGQENVQNDKRKKNIRIRFAPPMGLDLNFYTLPLFFNAHFRLLLCVYDRKGEGRVRECDKWIRNEWFR